MDNLANFKQSMALLAITYDKQLTDELIGIYWAALGHYEPQHLKTATELHIADPVEGRFMPKPAHLIAHIKRFEVRENKSKALTLYTENKKLESQGSEKTIDNQAAIGILKGLRA